MFFIGVNTIENSITQQISLKNTHYTINIRQYDDLHDFEKHKYGFRQDGFIIHISGAGERLHSELYVGNDLQWHSTNKALGKELVDVIGKMIDHHFL